MFILCKYSTCVTSDKMQRASQGKNEGVSRPDGPVELVGPLGPVQPVEPVEPVGPVEPVKRACWARWSPLGPSGPLSPSSPLGPLSPNLGKDYSRPK